MTAGLAKTSSGQIRVLVAPLLSALLLATTGSSFASAAPLNQASSAWASPGTADIIENLIIDTMRPLNRDQERAQQLALSVRMQSLDELAMDVHAEGAELLESLDTPSTDGRSASPTPAAQIGDVAETPSGQVRLCFRGDTPQLVRREALAAASQWDSSLAINGPVVEIEFYWLGLADPNILGAAGPSEFILHPSLPRPGARYPVALANELLGIDQLPRASCDPAGEGEIVLVLNADAGGNGGGWIAGQDMLDPSLDATEAIDLQTTMLHELGHGFGFIGSAEINDVGALAWPNDHTSPLVFDLFARSCQRETFQGCAVSDSTEVAVGDLDAVTSGKLWMSTGLGPLLELEAPFQWDVGSSFSHLDEYRYPEGSPFALMTPYIDADQRLRSIDTGTLAVMQMIGWTIEAPVAPITSVTGNAGPNQVALELGATSLAEGIPPADYLVQVRRLERNAAGDLTRVEAHQALNGNEALVTIEGLANKALYEVEVTALGAAGDGPTAKSGPLLPMPEGSAELYVDDMYDTFVGRRPTEPERVRFSNLAGAGDHGVQDAMAEVFARDEIFDQQVVARLYLGFLGRSPDLGGLRYWTNRLEDGSPIAQVADDFAAATRFETGLVLDDEDFVRQVYTSVLKRDPDVGGLLYWTRLLRDGVDRGRILIEISESVEHRLATPVLPEMLVAYLQWDDRLPSTDELDLWFHSVNGDGMGPLLSALIVDAIPLVAPATEPNTDGEFNDGGEKVIQGSLLLTLI